MSSSRRNSNGEETYSHRNRRRERSRSRSSSRHSYHSHSRRHRTDDGRDRYYDRRDSDRQSHRRRDRTRSRSRSREGTSVRYRDAEKSRRCNDDRYERSRYLSDRSRSPERLDEKIDDKDASQSQINSAEAGGISIKLGAVATQPCNVQQKSAVPVAPAGIRVLPPVIRSTTVAAIFNDDDDDEPEEMPPEAKMKMKNVGRNTPTSAGPNSFGKTKIGFCNSLHIAGKELEEKQFSSK